jgi:hypothetical protein
MSKNDYHRDLVYNSRDGVESCVSCVFFSLEGIGHYGKPVGRCKYPYNRHHRAYGHESCVNYDVRGDYEEE